MAISTAIVGKEFGPFVREYTFRDLEICASVAMRPSTASPTCST